MNLTLLSEQIDLDAALDRMCGDSDLLLEILDMFLAELRAEEISFLAHIQQDNFAWLASKAHYFKGVAQNLGLLECLDAIKTLEQTAKAHDTVACAAALRTLMNCAAQLQGLRNRMQGL